jgi:hypothetical protein
MSGEDVVRLVTLSTPQEAQLLRQALEAEGIRCQVVGELLGGLPPAQPAAEVWVGKADLEKARAVAAAHRIKGAPMRTIRDAAGQALRWAQLSAFSREYELRAGEEALATLRWQKAFGSLALATCAGGAWTFKRSGFLSPRVTVRRPESEAEVAVLKPGWRGEGTLELATGQSYPWRNTSFWRSEWAFTDGAGEPLVEFKPEFAFFKQAAEVKLGPRAGSVPDLSLLTLLGWYLMVLMSADSGAAAAGAVAGT